MEFGTVIDYKCTYTFCDIYVLSQQSQTWQLCEIAPLRQIIQGRQNKENCLSSFPKQDTHISTSNNNLQRLQLKVLK
jgi:hypothetical protein